LLDARNGTETLVKAADRIGINYKSAFDILRRRGLTWPRRKTSTSKGLTR